MAAGDSGEKSEAPTPKRRRDARRRGDVSKSQEIVSVGLLLVAVMTFRFFGPAFWGDLREIMGGGLIEANETELTSEAAISLGRDSLQRLVMVMLPLLAALTVGAIALNLAQTGFAFSTQKIKPNFKHVNPLSGAKRLVSMEGLVNLAKSLGKMGIVTIVVFITMKSQMNEIAGLGQLSVADGVGHLFGLAFDIALRASVVLFLLALGDYAYQRYKHNKQMKMTKTEVTQEMKETEGKPEIKQALRRQRMGLLNSMIAAVPDADVVVTNPTHVAVALKYDPLSMQAPIVVAKGERLVAQRIKQIAREAGVPVLEEPPLARALNKSTPIGHPVPAQLFHAVAEVLAWVFELRQRVSRTRPTQGVS